MCFQDQPCDIKQAVRGIHDMRACFKEGGGVGGGGGGKPTFAQPVYPPWTDTPLKT